MRILGNSTGDGLRMRDGKIVDLDDYEFDALIALYNALREKPRGEIDFAACVSSDGATRTWSERYREIFSFIQQIADAIEQSKIGKAEGTRTERTVTIARVINVKVE